MALADIKNIRLFSAGKKITGAILAASGVAVFASGIVTVSEFSDLGATSPVVAFAAVEGTAIGAGGVIVGTAMTLTGVALMARGKSYRRADHWEYAV